MWLLHHGKESVAEVYIPVRAKKNKTKKKRRKSASSDLIAKAGALVIPQLLFIHVVWSDCDTTLGCRNITLDG